MRKNNLLSENKRVSEMVGKIQFSDYFSKFYTKTSDKRRIVEKNPNMSYEFQNFSPKSTFIFQIE
jgi:hypothetical protein